MKNLFNLLKPTLLTVVGVGIFVAIGLGLAALDNKDETTGAGTDPPIAQGVAI